MKRVILCALLCFAGACALYSNAARAASDDVRATDSPSDEDNYRTYVEKIAEIESRPREFSPKAIYMYEPLLALAADGAKNMGSCLRFLAEEQGTRGRRVAIISMNQLGVDDYVVFIRRLVELQRKNLVNDYELMSALWGRYNYLVVEQYAHPKIQALLTEMEAQDDLPADVRRDVDSILSGRPWASERTSEFDRECHQSPRTGSIAFCVGLVARCAKYYLFTQVVYFVLDKPKRHAMQWFDRTIAQWRVSRAGVG